MSDKEIRDILDQLLKTGRFYVEYRQPETPGGALGPWKPLGGGQSGFMALLDYQKRVLNPASEEAEYRLTVATTEPIVLKWHSRSDPDPDNDD